MKYKPKIFLTESGKQGLTALEETGYVAERVLQRLLVDYPDLLPGDQINPENPRRWLLVSREMGVPDEADASGRWSLDHLFLDQDGIPTFVECKRGDDTRNRREVVAQMLDYAANGVEYWSMDRLRQSAAETAQTRGSSLDQEIAALMGATDDVIEEYWERVEENLRDHRVRLVFVADRTPKELRRLVEFLNEEMTNVEVLAVEIKQYKRGDKQDQKALVPRVVGLTESARAAKERSTERKPQLTRTEYLERCPSGIREFYQRVFDLAEERGHLIVWRTASFSLRAQVMGTHPTTFAYGWLPPRRFHFYFGGYLRRPEERASALRSSLLDFGVFEESGDYHLVADLAQEDLQQMNEVYNYILDQVERFIQRKQGDD